ncbi:MAG TPA: DUF1206 domain-containing protein [Polyangiaceae bacterium]|nr:DUF1206 domain-containing protein [Polyangiaceae bacterium]
MDRSRQALPWIARAGYLARGFLYLMIGGLAALAAFGQGGRATDSKGALSELYHQPFGATMLLLAACGLFGYAAFLLYQVVLDPERRARGWKAVKRPGWLIIAFVHGALGVFAIGLITGDSSGGDGNQEAQSRTAELLAWRPLGPWLVALIGIGLGIAAGRELYCAFKAKLDEQLDLSTLDSTARRWVVSLCRIGIASRAVVGAISAAFLIVAAATSDASEVKGFGQSLAMLSQTPLGPPLFVAIALGLLAFAFYELVEARYRTIGT